MAFSRQIEAFKKPTRNRFYAGLSGYILFGLLFGPAAHGAGPGQPLEETTAVRLGLQRPEVGDLLNARVDAARGTVRASGRWSNPEFQYERETVNGLGGGGTENFLSLSQEFDFSGQRRLQRRAAKKRLGAEFHEGDQYRNQLAAEIRQQFYAVLRGERLEKAMREWLAQLERLDGIIAKREAAGEASRYDRRRIAQERAAGPALLAEIRSAGAAARERLAALIGSDRLNAYDDVQGRILPPAPAPLEQLLTSLRERPDLRGLQAQAEAYGLDRRAARRSAIPDVTLSMGVRNIANNPGGDDNGLLLSASVPLPLFNRNQGETLHADGRARAARAEYLIRLRRARAEVTATRHRLESLRGSAVDYREEAVTPVAELKAIAEASYAAGETGVLELLDAYRTAFEVQRRALELAMQARLARIELQRLTGDSLP